MHEFVIDRKTWARGRYGESYLLSHTGQKCCLGFFAESCGIAQDKLLGVSTLSGLFESAETSIPSVFFVQAYSNGFFDDSQLSYRLMTVNDYKIPFDTDDIKRAEYEMLREQMIAELFALVDIKVTFEE